MTDERRLPLEGPGAPPRANGELVFAAPWEGRVFGMALALCERGVLVWEEFRAELIAEIGRWERAHADGQGYCYYARWQAALEALLFARGLLPGSTLEQRASELAARPHGHDHPPGQRD